MTEQDRAFRDASFADNSPDRCLAMDNSPYYIALQPRSVASIIIAMLLYAARPVLKPCTICSPCRVTAKSRDAVLNWGRWGQRGQGRKHWRCARPQSILLKWGHWGQ